jgi:hypothetical protein
MATAFNNPNQNQFGNLNFTDWSQVADMFGTEVVSALQKNNVPLNQQTTPGQQFGAANPQFVSSGFTLADAINQQQGGGGQSQQQGPSFDPTQNPNYPTSLLGAQALNAVGLNPTKQVTTNPSPANTPSSTEFAKSGVSAVASPMTTTYGGNNPQTNVPSVFTQATAVRPTGRLNTIQPTPQATGAQFNPGTAYASPPPVQAPVIPSTLPPAPAAPTGTPGANYANTATGVTQGIPPSPSTAMFHPDINPTGPNPTRPGLTSARM